MVMFYLSGALNAIRGGSASDLLGKTEQERKATIDLARSIKAQGLLDTGMIAPVYYEVMQAEEAATLGCGIEGIAEWKSQYPDTLKALCDIAGADLKDVPALPDSGNVNVLLSGNRRWLIASLMGLSAPASWGLKVKPKDEADRLRYVVAGNPATQATLGGRQAVKTGAWLAAILQPGLSGADCGYADAKHPQRLGIGVGGVQQRVISTLVAALVVTDGNYDNARALVGKLENCPAKAQSFRAEVCKLSGKGAQALQGKTLQEQFRFCKEDCGPVYGTLQQFANNLFDYGQIVRPVSSEAVKPESVKPESVKPENVPAEIKGKEARLTIGVLTQFAAFLSEKQGTPYNAADVVAIAEEFIPAYIEMLESE